MRARRAALANGVVEITLQNRSFRSLRRQPTDQLTSVVCELNDDTQERSATASTPTDDRDDRCSSVVQTHDELVAYRPPVQQAADGGGDDSTALGAVEPETSTQRLEREIAETERRLSEATARAERVQQAMNDVLAKELSAMRDMVGELDREHEAALAAVRIDSEAEAEKIIADATAFVESTELGEARA